MTASTSGKAVGPYTLTELRDIAYHQSEFGDVSALSRILFNELGSELEFGVSDGKEEFIEAILDRQRELGMTP